MFLILIFYALIFAVAFHLVFYHKYNFPKYVKEIEKIPGPKGVFYFGHILRFYQLKSEDLLGHVGSEFKRWGPTLKYWYSGVAVVLVSDIDDVQAIMSSKLNYEKGIMYEHIKPWLGTGLLTSKGEKWKMMRKIITPTFHFSILKQYVQVFTKNAKIMMNLLSECKNKEACELNDFVTYCALDSIYETSMGKCINSQLTKSENEYVKAIFRIGQIIVERLFSPFLYMDHMFMLSSIGKESAKLLEILHGVTSRLIKERKQQYLTGELEKHDGNDDAEKKQIPFIDLLLEKQKVFHFSDVDLRQEVDTVLMAGHDTTSTALNWCFFELGHNERIQDKVYDELQSIFGNSDREPTYQDLLNMEYLKKVLQETLRLYPSVPVISRKFDVDVQLKNYLIPARTEIVVVLYHIHRNPQIFPEPEVFDPDRFSPPAVNQRNPFAYIPFSAGSRNCLGQKYAMLQMLAISSSILRKYKIKSLNAKHSVKPVPDVILRPNVTLRWKLTPRK